MPGSFLSYICDMKLNYSFVIPVYNRPQEIKELLLSMQQLDFPRSFEIVIVEDGSTETAAEVVRNFEDSLNITYLTKPNSGPGDSRNYGMKRAKGDYFLILDSDVILPEPYLTEVDTELTAGFVHCFGGPDAAHESFTAVQKAINFTMTSFLTTGGIRGGQKRVGSFQPRSFNMGLSREAFEKSGGFGRIHPGEDPDLVLRLWKMGYKTRLFPDAFVYHKRRIDWKKFYTQVNKFGLVRPVLNQWHPESAKATYWFPTLFTSGLFLSIVLMGLGYSLFLFLYLGYFLLIFLDSFRSNHDLKIAVYSVWAALLQFLGYGLGFCRSTCYIRFFNEPPEKRFPKLFFQHAKKD